MSNKKLIILGCLAVLTVIAAVIQSRLAGKQKPSLAAPAYLVQGLDPDDIHTITLQKENDKVTFKRLGTQFVVEEKDNYPAKAVDINKLIAGCMDVDIAQMYTDDPTNHADLGVTEQNAKRIVKFLRSDSSMLAGIVIGNFNDKTMASFVRLASSDKVYRSSAAPWFNPDPIGYIEKKLLAVDRDNIRSVTVNSPDAQYTIIAEPNSPQPVLQDLPTGEKQKDGPCNMVFNALNYLQFEDVKAAATQTDQPDFDKTYYTCLLKDSTVYTIKIANIAGKPYITCTADYTDKTRVTKDRIVESEAQLKEKEAKLIARDNAAKFAEKHRGWLYQVPASAAENLTKQLADLIEGPEPEPQPKPASTGKKPAKGERVTLFKGSLADMLEDEEKEKDEQKTAENDQKHKDHDH